MRNPQTAWTDGTSRFVAKLGVGDHYRIVGFSAGSHSEKVLTEGSGTFEFSPRGSSAQGSILAWQEDLHTMRNLFLFTQELKVKEPVTAWAGDLPHLGDIDLKWLESKIKTSDGKESTVRTALLVPAPFKTDQPPRTVIFAYPGADVSRYAADFAGGDPAHGFPAEVLLRAGMAVALADLPLGPEGKPGEPIQEMTSALLPQLESLAKSGWVDPDRFALVGQSYGGYMAASVISATPKLKAAVAISGVYDLASNYGLLVNGAPYSIEWSEKGQGRMGSPLWNDPERYLRNSPYFQADHIHTPLLLIHGTEEENYVQAGQMFTALKRLGRPAEFASYPGEGHAPSAWTLDHQADLVQRILEFLQRNL